MAQNSLDPAGADCKRFVTSLRGMGLVSSATPRIVMLTGGVSPETITRSLGVAFKNAELAVRGDDLINQIKPVGR